MSGIRSQWRGTAAAIVVVCGLFAVLAAHVKSDPPRAALQAAEAANGAAISDERAPADPSQDGTFQTTLPEVAVQEILRLRELLQTAPLCAGEVFEPLPLSDGYELPSLDPQADEQALIETSLRNLAGIGRSGPMADENGLHETQDTQGPLSPQWQPGEYDGDRADVLRQAAWQLDQIAHTLECADLYSRSDEVREMGQRLRLQARSPSAQRGGRLARLRGWPDETRRAAQAR